MKYNKAKDIEHYKLDKALVLADEYCSKNSDKFKYSNGEKSFYFYQNGVYKALFDVEAERFFMDEAVGEFESINYLSVEGLKKFMRRCGQLNFVKSEDFNNSEIINFENGIYDIKTDKFQPHDPKYLSTIRIPYEYQPDSICAMWLDFLNSSLEGDIERIIILQEFMGYCLGKDNSFQKALFLLGEPGAGKGTILRIIEKMVGKENCSALSLDGMVSLNGMASLINKLVNIDADVSTMAKGFESRFNKITGQDSIMAKVLWQNEFRFKPYCKMVFAANELPKINDKTNAFYRRMLPIKFDISFQGKEDFELEDKLEKELSGILMWSLEGRKRLYKQKAFSIGKKLFDFIEEIKKDNNPVELYVEECVGVHDDKRTGKNDLYDHYKKWCEHSGHLSLSKIRFGKEIWRIMKDVTRKDVRGGGFDNERIWPNIYIKGSQNEPVTTKQWGE